MSGTVADVADQIQAARGEARERKGWIMDTYLLRRPGQPAVTKAARDPRRRLHGARAGRNCRGPGAGR